MICLAHNAAGQDIHDHDIRMGRPCSLCQTAATMTDAAMMAEEARIMRAEVRR